LSWRPWSREQKLDGFVVVDDRLDVPDDNAFRDDPVNFIRLFHVAEEHGLDVHPRALRVITQSLKLIDAELRADPEANGLFLHILTSRNSPEIVLRLMNEAGVLGRFIPDFGRIVALMQFNMYHHFTVDEHLLRAVGHLADMEARRFVEGHPLASAMVASIEKRTSLYLALFLHDIAKGRPEDHSIAGAEVARHLCKRFRMSEAETETVAWLVTNHLIMSDTAQRRDLGDRRTIETFAAKVQTLERLKMLHVLTVCDIYAVGPGVWNGWKGELLRTLYWETEVVLAGGHSTWERTRRVEAAKTELREQLPNWSDADFASYAARHQQAYWLKVDLPHKLNHARLLNMTEVEMPTSITNVTTDAFRAVTELSVIAADHPRLLSTIAGACAASAANIVDAQIFTTTDGLALDTIVLSRAFDRDDDELRRAHKIALAIERALRSETHLQELISAKDRAWLDRGTTFRVPSEVSVDNNLSLKFTVVEVSCHDRPGLLYDVTNALTELALNIGSAHIATFGEKAADVFYVTDLNGDKITAKGPIGTIKRKILHALVEAAPAVAAT